VRSAGPRSTVRHAGRLAARHRHRAPSCCSRAGRAAAGELRPARAGEVEREAPAMRYRRCWPRRCGGPPGRPPDARRGRRSVLATGIPYWPVFAEVAAVTAPSCGSRVATGPGQTATGTYWGDPGAGSAYRSTRCHLRGRRQLQAGDGPISPGSRSRSADQGHLGARAQSYFYDMIRQRAEHPPGVGNRSAAPATPDRQRGTARPDRPDRPCTRYTRRAEPMDSPTHCHTAMLGLREVGGT